MAGQIAVVIVAGQIAVVLVDEPDLNTLRDIGV